MAIQLSDLGHVYIVCGKTDMRQGIDSLAYLVKSHFDLNPFSGQVYLFYGGRKDRFKALYWDGQGFWLLYKRFENGKVTWPNTEKEVKALTSEQVRQDKLNQLLKELNSLNREIKSGNVYCTDCGSSNISFKNRDVNFDLSNVEVRKQVLNSIDFQILMSKNEITELTEELNEVQDEFKTLLKDTPKDFKKSLLYSEIINTDIDYDDKLLELNKKLHSLQFDKSILEQRGLNNKEAIKLIKEDIVTKMNTLYKEIDPSGKLIFDDLFTKKDATYSGSDGQVYYFCRLISLNNLLKHSYPIINDSFREGEISN